MIGGQLAMALCRVAMLFLLAVVPPAGAQENDLEYALKATYLYKFAPFVEWPQQVFSSPTAPVAICILSDPSFAALVGRAVAGQETNGHSFKMLSLGTPDQEGSCQILFIPTLDPAAVREALAVVSAKPVLTVTETTGSAPHGIINFVVADNRVRFEIDLAEAERNNLAISSKLLGIAVSVYPPPTQKQP